MNRTLLRDRRATAGAAVIVLGIAVACLGNATPRSAIWDPTCTAAAAPGVRWVRTSALNERPSLDRWCAGVGPPARMDGRQAADVFTGPFVVVSWNTHVGAGDIDAFVADLRSGRLTGHPVSAFVLLLQEAYRGGADVPSRSGVRWASAGQPPGTGDARVEVTAAATRLGLSAIYIPSMRNGAPGATSEDRGNAILSSVRLSDVTAIELPLERQRRVAIAATVNVQGRDRGVQPVRLVCTHFTNMVMHHVWVLSESGRLRQARALAQALPADGSLILGGDLNSWFGYHDAAYRQLAGTLSRASAEDRRPTFGPMRLDHLLFRLPDAWRTEVRRVDQKYGSDHYPIIAMIDAPQ
jgi:endonuclease/exonuclease/phosphatase family metal-dependent hydrolase